MVCVKGIMAANEMEVPGISEFLLHLSSKENCISYLRKVGVLKESTMCNLCQNDMTTVSKPVRVTSDLEMWCCHRCSRNTSIRNGSIFYVSIDPMILDRKHNKCICVLPPYSYNLTT